MRESALGARLGAELLRPDRHRSRPDLDPPGEQPGDQHLGEPGPLALAPIIGAAIAGISYAAITGANRSRVDEGIANNP